eukprot:g3173.t1
MAGGPPSSVDIGDGYGDGGYGGYGGGGGYGSASSSSSLTYYEKKFGGYGGEGDFDPSSFIPSYTPTDKALALFRLIFAASFFVLGIYALIRFYRSRWVLDIRTRSAYLVMLGGICVLLTMLVSINGALNVVWGKGTDWFYNALVLFFTTPALLGSYICRALRLAVVFHPKAKRALPWLIPERNYMVVLLIGSLGMMAIPIYHEYNLPVWEIIPKQTTISSWVSIAFAVILACLYPFIRKVDDLFNISKELIAVTVVIMLLTVGQKAVWDHGGVLLVRWLGNNLSTFLAACLFGISVVDPLRRLAFDPLAATKQNYADRVLLARSQPRSTAKTASGLSSGIGGDSENEARTEEGRTSVRPATTTRPRGQTDGGSGHGGMGPSTSSVSTSVATSAGAPSASNSTANDNNESSRRAGALGGERDDAGGGRGGNDGATMEVWNFERLGRTPLLAAAFEDFSRKALCHESVLFLSEVSRYESGDFGSSPTSPPSQFGMFCYITDTFIKAGSIEEVNISDADKRRIVDLYHKGQASFEAVNEEERRMVFMHAYIEVRQMLEANLLRRFLRTDRHITALLEVGAQLSIFEERVVADSEIRPRPGSLRGEGQRVTGLSWQAIVNGDELMVATGTARVEAATDSVRAVGGQKAWDWALREEDAERRNDSGYSNRRRVLYSSDSSAEGTPSPTPASIEYSMAPTAPSPEDSSAPITPSAGDTTAPVATPLDTPAPATLTVSPAVEPTAEPTPGVSAEPQTLGPGAPPESSPTVQPTGPAPLMTPAPRTPTTATPFPEPSISPMAAPAEDAPTAYLSSDAPFSIPEGVDSPENPSAAPIASTEGDGVLSTPAPLFVWSAPSPETPTPSLMTPTQSPATVPTCGSCRAWNDTLAGDEESKCRPCGPWSNRYTCDDETKCGFFRTSNDELAADDGSNCSSCRPWNDKCGSCGPWSNRYTCDDETKCGFFRTSNDELAFDDGSNCSSCRPWNDKVADDDWRNVPVTTGASVAPVAPGTTSAPSAPGTPAPHPVAPTLPQELTTAPATEPAPTVSPVSVESSAPASTPTTRPVASTSSAMATPGPPPEHPSASPFDQPITAPTPGTMQPVATPAPGPRTPAAVPTGATSSPVASTVPTTTRPAVVASPSVAPIAPPSGQPVTSSEPPMPETTHGPTIAVLTTVEQPAQVVPGTTIAPVDVAMPLAPGATLPPDEAPVTHVAPSIQPVVEQQPSVIPGGSEQPMEAPPAEPTASTEEASPVVAPTATAVPAPAAVTPSSSAAPAEAPQKPVAPSMEELPPPAPQSPPAAEAPAVEPPESREEAPPVVAPIAAPVPAPTAVAPSSPVETPTNAPMKAPLAEPAPPVLQEVPEPAPEQEAAPTEPGTEAPFAAPVDSPLPVEAPVEGAPPTEPAPAAAPQAVPVAEQQPVQQPAVEAPTSAEIPPVSSPEAATPASPPTVQFGTPGEPGAPNSRDLPTSSPDGPSTVPSDPPTTASPVAAETVVVIPGTVAAGAVSAFAIGAAVVAALGTAASSGGGGGGGGVDPGAGNAVANANQNAPRAPSAILGAVAVSQLQFLATLSLVDNTGSEDSSLPGFADSFRWVNLWPPASFAEEFIGTSGEEGQMRRLQQKAGEGSGEGSALECSWDGTDVNNLGALVFIGNLCLVFGTLLLIFLVHIALVSAVESFWLAKKRAKMEVSRARRRGIPIDEYFNAPRDEQPRIPEPDADPSGAAATTNSIVTTSSRSLRNPPSFRNVAATRTSRRWLAKVPALNAATIMHRVVRPRAGSGGGDYDGNDSETDCSDEEEGGWRCRPVLTRVESRLSPVAECREHSTSAWLHFPHVELVVLFFAFEGAVASQVSALRGGDCPSVTITAAVALFLYPVLMFAGVLRTYFVRVRPKTLIVFTPSAVADGDGDGEGVDGAARASRSGLFSRVKAGLAKDHSMFAWANKGEWETAETGDERTKREGQWFLIGFEPLFADFTQSGAWFVAFTLVEWISLACIGALIDESVLQLSLFCGLHMLSFLLLVVFKPLANSVINAMAAGLMAVDATCTALLAISASRWDGTAAAARVDSAVMLLQLLALCALIIPIYIDTSLVVLGAIRSRMRKSATPNSPDAQTEE